MGTIDWLRPIIGFIEMTKIVKFGNSFNNNELSFFGNSFNNNELSFLSICCCYSIFVILDVVS